MGRPIPNIDRPFGIGRHTSIHIMPRQHYLHHARFLKFKKKMADHFENWRAIWSFESWEAVQEAAVGALHEAGVNVPREDCLLDRDTVSQLTSILLILWVNVSLFRPAASSYKPWRLLWSITGVWLAAHSLLPSWRMRRLSAT